MKIKYLGTEFTEVFGMSWKPGETQDVADAYAAEKLRFNPLFEAADAKDRPKPGDAPAALKPSEKLEATAQRTAEMVNRAIEKSMADKKKEAGA